MSDYVIETSKLCKKYPKTEAVDDLDLKVPKGSVYGFLGRNGAGKTTSIKMMTGIINATSGSSKVLGLNSLKEKDGVEIRRRTGIVSENPRMYQYMKVKEIISFTSAFYKTWNREVERELLKKFGLDENKKISEGSRGMVGQLALLLALSFEPELLVLDEPTAGLDAVVRRSFLDGIIDLIQKEGRTVFFSSHQIDEVERVADWVGIIDKGRLMVSAPIDELKARVKRIVAVFAENAPESINIPGIISAKVNGREFTAVVEGKMEIIKDKFKTLKPASINVHDMPLEDIFIAYVGGQV